MVIFHSPGFAELESLVLLPSERQKGYGSRLLNEVESTLKERYKVQHLILVPMAPDTFKVGVLYHRTHL